MGDMQIPEGRTVRDRDDEAGVALDMLLYGDAYCSAPGPDSVGALLPAVDGTHH